MDLWHEPSWAVSSNFLQTRPTLVVSRYLRATDRSLGRPRSFSGERSTAGNGVGRETGQAHPAGPASHACRNYLVSRLSPHSCGLGNCRRFLGPAPRGGDRAVTGGPAIAVFSEILLIWVSTRSPIVSVPPLLGEQFWWNIVQVSPEGGVLATALAVLVAVSVSRRTSVFPAQFLPSE